jgi:IclR family acetate operon transcriptional repressor
VVLESRLADSLTMPPRSNAASTVRRTAAAGKPRGAAQPGAGERGAAHTQALSRGLAVLAELAATDGGATLTTLAARSGLPAPTVHRLLATLEAAGYVQSGTHGEWLVGLAAFRAGSAFLHHRNLVAHVFPYLKLLMERSGETANLAVMDAGEAVFVEQVQCRELMRMNAKLGARAPLHASGVGKAMLAALDERAASALLGRNGLARFTPHTFTVRDALAGELAATRARGYAVDDEEHALGLRCVAAALRDEHGETWAALSLAGPTTRFTAARVPDLGALVRDTAHEVTRALGGSPPRHSAIAAD